MAIANFFDKVCLSAAQALRNFNRDAFLDQLMQQTIAIVYGSNAAHTAEGMAALELLIRVTARLYPNIKIVTSVAGESSNKLKQIARDINPQINLDQSQEETIAIVVGDHDKYTKQVPVFYIGSDGWLAKFSIHNSQPCGGSNNPFGAGAAVCFAAANLFRTIFAANLTQAKLDQEFSFSTYNYQLTNDPGPALPDVVLKKMALIGLGAIGNGVIWAFQKLESLKGTVHFVDHEAVELSNLQRYVMAFQQHVSQDKVGVAELLLKKNRDLQVRPFKGTWVEFVNSTGGGDAETIALAIDNIENRVFAQSALPLKVFNAWTSPLSLGISRHLNFEGDPCVCCLYLPVGPQKSLSQNITDSLGLPEVLEPQIRYYLANKKGIDQALIKIILAHNPVDEQLLLPYEGRQLEIFYSEVVCGGKMIQVQETGKKVQAAEVPLAHESALAGILLASELVIDASNLRVEKIAPLSKINLMAPITRYVLEKQLKHHSGRCICQDPIFVKRYKSKWQLEKK